MVNVELNLGHPDNIPLSVSNGMYAVKDSLEASLKTSVGYDTGILLFTGQLNVGETIHRRCDSVGEGDSASLAKY